MSLSKNQPPSRSLDGRGTLSSLSLCGVGPATACVQLRWEKLHLEFAERVNLITGDNGLGKPSSIDNQECAWWALSGKWASSPAYPRDDAPNAPQITFELADATRAERASSSYDWKKQEWPLPEKNGEIPSLLIYARFDGAFAVWDPARNHSRDLPGFLLFKREEVWDGLPSQVAGKTRYLGNGLINDWVNWQNNPNMYPFETLKRVLRRLSPPELARGDLGLLEPGKPKRIPGDSRWIPTIKHPYQEVPLVYASAAVRRIVALAYLIVWTYEEHKTQSDLIREKPASKMVILVDEIESHLHPQWQRQILPALLDVQEDLEADVEVQFLIATHSPLVLASMEPTFDVQRDKIFHLDLDLSLVQGGATAGEVMLEEPNFTRYGTVDAWLMSDIFELRHARSLLAEEAIEDAKKLQMQEQVTEQEVREVVKYVAAHDRFWPRWTFFAEQHGVEL